MSEWLVWAWVIGVDLAVVVAAVFATYDRTRLASLRPQHVGAAAIVGVLAWEAAANVVASVVAGAGQFTGLDIAFLAAQAIFAGASAVMIVFVLRRRRWAVVLGVGLALSRFVLAILGVIEITAAAGGLDAEGLGGTVVFVILGALPLLAAVWLFLDPFLRGEIAWRGDGAPEVDSSSVASSPDTTPEAAPDA
jgi:hypothetical protein